MREEAGQRDDAVAAEERPERRERQCVVRDVADAAGVDVDGDVDAVQRVATDPDDLHPEAPAEDADLERVARQPMVSQN